jgi:hypothetical protein
MKSEAIGMWGHATKTLEGFRATQMRFPKMASDHVAFVNR